mgnify:CR=1
MAKGAVIAMAAPFESRSQNCIVGGEELGMPARDYSLASFLIRLKLDGGGTR